MRNLIVAASLLVLAACGSDFCKSSQTSSKNLKTKMGTCSNFTTFTAATDAQVTACQNGKAACSADDQKKLSDAQACTDALPNCTEDTQTDFTAKLVACGEKSSSISATCKALIGIP